jgi:hypothetical protein
MSKTRAKSLGVWAVLLGLAFPAACGSSGVVGGRCSASHVECNGQCVDTLNDANNCGGCGRKCEPGVSCEDALCEGVPAGGGGASGNGGGSGNGGSSAESGASGNSGIAGEDDAGNLTDASPDGDAGCRPPYNTAAHCGDCQTSCSGSKPICAPYGEDEYVCVGNCQPPLVECNGQCVENIFDTPEACGQCDVKCSGSKPLCSPNADGTYVCKSRCDDPLVECNGQCVPPVFDTPEACGACNAECPTSKPTCSPDDMGNFKCVLVCEDPLQECNGQCVDFNIDVNNCGKCGNHCESGICQGGTCVGAYDGNIMLACMNYQTPMAGSPQTVLMGNAVFLTLREPVRILAYTEFASAESRAKVDQDIAYAASARQRTFTISALDRFILASARLNIANYDVFLIYDQADAPTGQLATIGAVWQANSVLNSFAAAGGMIIGLSGGTSEMDEFFTESGLLAISAQTPVATGSTLYKSALGDVLGANLISPFAAPADSCTFTTAVMSDASTTFVVRDQPAGGGEPVVVHRVITAPVTP